MKGLDLVECSLVDMCLGGCMGLGVVYSGLGEVGKGFGDVGLGGRVVFRGSMVGSHSSAVYTHVQHNHAPDKMASGSYT